METRHFKSQSFGLVFEATNQVQFGLCFFFTLAFPSSKSNNKATLQQ